MPTLKECLGKSIIPLPYQNELLSKVQSLALEHGVEKASMMAIQDLHGSASSELGKMLGQFGLDAKNLKDYSIKGVIQPAAQADQGPFPVVGTQNTTFANRGEAPTKEIVQVGPPIAGAVVGGLLAGPVGFAAGGVIGGEFSNFAQGYTPTVGERVTQAAGMLPIGVAGGIVKQGVINATQQIAAKQVGQNVDQAVAGQSPTLLPASELYSPDVLAAGLAPAVAGGVGRVAQGVDDAVAVLNSGGTVREAAKTLAVSPLVRPGEITQRQQARNNARAAIKTITGEDVPVTVSEAIGRFDIAKLKNEITPESQSRLQKVAMWAAAEHPELKNMDVETRAAFVQELLKSEGRGVSIQVARDVANSAAAVAGQLGGDVKQAVPGTMSESVNRLRGEADKGLKVAKDGYDKAYEEARATPGFSTIQVVPQEATLAAFKILEVPGITIDPKVKRVIDSLSLGMDYDSAKSLKTYITDSIGTESLLPGVSDGQKKFLTGALSKDMNAALKENPKAASLMKEANTKFAKAQESFNTLFSEQTVKKVGEEGGSTAGTIVTKLSGSSGDDYLSQLREMKKYNPEILPAARDSVVAKLIKEQGSNPQGMLDSINKMADGVKAEFFPNLKQIESLANRSAALSGITGLKGDALLSKIKDTDAFAAALTDRSKGSVSATVTALLGDTASSIRGFKNEVIQDATLAGKRPLDFIDGVTSGNLYKQSEITEVMAKLPDDAKADVRQSMMNRIIGKANGDADAMLEILNDRAQGPRIKTILGDDEHAFLVKTAQDLRTLTPGAPDAKKPGSLIAALTRSAVIGGVAYQMTKSPYWTAGAAGVALAKDSLYNSIPRLQQIGGDAKFDMASKLLSTPALREMAVTPVDKLNPDQIRFLGAFLAEEIRRSENQSK